MKHLEAHYVPHMLGILKETVGNITVQHVKLPSVKLSSHMCIDFSLAVSLPNQLPSNLPGEASEDDPKAWVPSTMLETSIEFLALVFNWAQTLLLQLFDN